MVNFKKVVFDKEYPTPPAGLLKLVMGKVAAASLAQEGRKHLYVTAFFSFLSFFVAALSLYKMEVSVSQNGFLSMFSLLFSDFEVVAAYWKSFAFSLAERLPLLSLIAASGSLFIFTITLKLINNDVKKYFSHSRHASL